MRKILFVLGISLLVFCAYFYFQKNKHKTTFSNSGAIQEALHNVSKLIVTEGHFSDIITYKDAKEIYLSWFRAEKKAVVLVNAKATVSYNLRQLEFVSDSKTKTLFIKYIPDPELQIYPKLEYYDIQSDFLNEFNAEDYNKISETVDARLKKQIAQSSLLTNAQNRLISEIYSTLNNQGIAWKVVYQPSKTLLKD